MGKQLLNQRYIYKINSSYLKRNKWKIEIKDIQKAIKTRMIVAIGDSCGTRMIRTICNSNATEDKINELKEDILDNMELLKDTNDKNIKTSVKKLIKEKYKLMLEENLCNVVFEKKKHYDEAAKHGFTINNIKYKLLLGTSGGIKQNTVLFINEKYFDEVWECINGDIDPSIEMLPSKLMAYMALTFSASTPVTNTKNILVVKDVETKFKDKVTTIQMTDDDIEPTLKPEEIEVEVNACDGCGMIDPKLSNTWSEDLGLDYVSPGYCVRNLWVKGMLTTFDFKKYCKEVIYKEKIVDVWGNEHDINDIDIILNESMLKCWKMYDSLESYLKAVDKNHYEFSVTKYVHDEIENTRMLNYQYTQCLDLDNDDIKNLLKDDMNEIKGVQRLDYRKSIVFGKGKYLNDSNVWTDADDDLHIKALMVNKEAIKDSYVKGKLQDAISKRIKMLKTSKINVEGNYQIVVGEPVIQLENMFGLEPKGLLKSGEFYIEYWREKGVKKVASFRSPMSCKENARIMNVVDDENINRWYGDLRGLIVFNGWDTTMMAENGCDFDGDLSFTTSNEIIVNSVYELPAINCIGNTSDKKSNITRKDYIKAIKDGFGNKVGSVTNVGSSLYDTLSKFEVGSEEYETIDNRIKKIQWYQQECIDSAKNGKPPKSLPKEWSELKECVVNINHETGVVLDDLDVVDKKDFNRKIITNKKPYFFRYVYDTTDKEYRKFISDTNENCINKFRCTVSELILKKDRTDEENDFLVWYDKRNPLSENNCVVNRIARVVEQNFNENIVNENEYFDWSIYITNEYDVDDYKNEITKIKQKNKEFITMCRNKNKLKVVGDKEGEYSSYNDELSALRDELISICPNDDVLCYLLLYLSYEKTSISKKFAWMVSGYKILENLLKNNNYTIHYPKRDDDGEFVYGGNVFKMIEKKINVEARGMKIWNYISERALAEQLQDEIDNKKTINENINSKLIAYVKLLKEQGMTKEDIRNRLDEIMLAHYKGVDMTAWNKPLNAMVNKYTTKENCEFRELNEINITRKELEFINRFQDEAKENLLFTMLVVSKSKHCKFKKNKKGEILSENHDYWLNCDRVQLFKLANFKYDKNTGAKTRMEQRGYFIYDLAQLDGTIELSKQCDNTSIKLLYVDEEVDPEGITFRITENNMNDVLNYYLQWKNPDEYTKCEECDMPIKKSNNKIKYCKKCSKKIKIEQTIKSNNLKNGK